WEKPYFLSWSVGKIFQRKEVPVFTHIRRSHLRGEAVILVLSAAKMFFTDHQIITNIISLTQRRRCILVLSGGNVFSTKVHSFPNIERCHTGEKPFFQSGCGKFVISQKAHLCSHQTFHTGRDEYSVQTCGKNVFSNKSKS
ncbi:unnamed protein product, partial [Staurois parvus]